MKIRPTEPDIETIYGRVKRKSLDLQPDFQRAEVWKVQKKRLLIDTILRDWQVPPIHVIYDSETCIQEVLDGQQRLRAIVDFMDGLFKVNGYIEPHDEEIIALDNMKYDELPEKARNRFDRYAIRFFEITEYNQGEPGELFNRLNEALKLTSAEKRNAYVGKLRGQMKSLVNTLFENDVDSKFLGFSNQRLAYHDLFIKLCFLIENNNLLAKYTEKSLNDRARDDVPFDEVVISSVKFSLETFGKIKKELEERKASVHITKASFFSWLFFISSFYPLKSDAIQESIVVNFCTFELGREQFRKEKNVELFSEEFSTLQTQEIYEVFTDRSTSKVMTSSSLIMRDLIIKLANYRNSESLFTESERKELKLVISEIMEYGVKETIESFSELKVIGEFI